MISARRSSLCRGLSAYSVMLVAFQLAVAGCAAHRSDPLRPPDSLPRKSEAPATAPPDTVEASAPTSMPASTSDNAAAPATTPMHFVESPANASQTPLPGSLPIHTFTAFPSQSPADLNRQFGADGNYEVRVRPDAPPQVVSSCRELIALPLSEDIDVGNALEIQSFWSTAVDCLALSILQNAKPARKGRLTKLLSAKDATRLLPPQLGLTDFADDRHKVNEAAAHCRSWKAHDPSLHRTRHTSNGFSVQADIWSGEVSFYARADFDSDGYEDLLVRRDGHADEGSYGATALFLLSRTEDDACIRVAWELGRS